MKYGKLPKTVWYLESL